MARSPTADGRRSRPVRARRGVALAAAVLVIAACGGGKTDGRPGASTGPTVRTSDRSATTATTGPAATPAARPCPPGPFRDVPYVRGGDRWQRLDVYPPTGACPAPVVVWVHGGGWITGDKENLGAKRNWARRHGWVLVSVNYRLTDPRAPEPQRWPAHNEDVAAALAFLRTDGARFGGDPDRIALIGHSAGAVIAAALANDPRYLGAHGMPLGALACVVPLDTEGFDVTGPASRPGLLGRLYRQAFGDDPAVWREASPITHVRAGSGIPPTFLVQRDGPPWRREVVDRYASTLRQAGVAVTVVELPGFTHADVNRRIGTPGEDVLTPALDRFLRRCLAGD